MHISVFLHTVLHCFHWEHRQVERVRSAHGGSLRYEGIGQNSKLICYSERGEPKLSFEYKFVGHTWKLIKLYTTVHAYLSFYTLYCIVSTENTGKLKCECEVICYWKGRGSLRYEVFLHNLPENTGNSKLICYSERGEPKLSFEYKFVGHTWKLIKLYPRVHAYLFFLYCIVSTENTGKLKECEVYTEAL